VIPASPAAWVRALICIKKRFLIQINGCSGTDRYCVRRRTDMTATPRTAGWKATLGASVLLAAALVGQVAAGRHTDTGGRMTTEQNKAAALRWSQELWGQGNLAVADEIIAPDYVRHDPGDPFPARGPEDVKRIVTMLRRMLPDLQIRVEAVIAEGDMVVNRYTATATDTVGYMGMPPTGKVIRTPAIQIFRFANGKIVESWAARDDLGTLRQLGHLAVPGGSQQQKRDERREQP
jgi:steroid delta-isomerase-like uncharacterized protein